MYLIYIILSVFMTQIMDHQFMTDSMDHWGISNILWSMLLRICTSVSLVKDKQHP